jgi:hypothetical protein
LLVVEEVSAEVVAAQTNAGSTLPSAAAAAEVASPVEEVRRTCTAARSLPDATTAARAGVTAAVLADVAQTTLALATLARAAMAEARRTMARAAPTWTVAAAVSARMPRTTSRWSTPSGQARPAAAAESPATREAEEEEPAARCAS